MLSRALESLVVMVRSLTWLAILAGSSLFLTADAADRLAIGVRGGNHENYSRIVFDFGVTENAGPPDYRIRSTRGGIIITFPLEVRFEFSETVQNGLEYISNPRTLLMEGGAAAAFKVVEQHEIRDFIDNNNLVIDVLYQEKPEGDGREDREVAETPETVTPDGGIAENDVPENMDTDLPLAADDEAPKEVAEGALEEEIIEEPVIPVVPVVPVMPAGEGTDSDQPATPVDPELSDIVVFAASEGEDIDNPAAIGTQPVPVVVQEPQGEQPLSAVPVLSIKKGADNGAGLTLRFSWPYSVAAAVFERSGTLWTVFDEEARFDLRIVQPYLNDILLGVEQEHGEGYVALRFPLKEGINARVIRDGDAWLLELSTRSHELSNPVPIARQENAGEGGQLFAPLDRPGLLLDLLDPRIGDRLDILPVASPSTGTAEERRFAEFVILKSAQGMVLQRFSDQVVLTRFSNGMAIASLRRLAVSDAQLQNSIGDEEEDFLVPARLIDFEGWRLGNLNVYNRNRHQLMRSISLAEGPNINLKRWDLARFYLGHNLNVEALAMLDLMLEADPFIIKDPRYMAIRGLVFIGQERYYEAYRLLDAPELNAETDIYLWRALAAEADGEYETAMEDYIIGREVLDYYNADDIARFRLAAVRAALASENYDVANWELSLVTTANVSPARVHEGEYLQGRLLEALGETEEAMAYYRAAEAGESEARRPAAYAVYERLMSELTREVIDTATAVEGLELLHFTWGDDAFKLKLLTTLGRLYLDEKKYRIALESLRRGLKSYPESPEARKIMVFMTDIFRALFLDGEADQMAPIPALAIYYDFRELTPLGADGDLLIRRLADRLVGVDLLSQAAKLLDHQVRFRLEGAAQAIVAIRLAKIYLLDRRADLALDILLATRQDKMPSDVVHDRVMIEARVLTQLSRYEEAEVMLESFRGHDVEMLLSDIHWGAQNWSQLASITASLLGDRWQDAEPLSSPERQDLIRLVIALALTGEGRQLATLRRQYGRLMQEGRFSNAFYVITNTEDFASDEFMEIVRQTAAVESLESFMDSYRAEFATDDSSTAVTNTAP